MVNVKRVFTLSAVLLATALSDSARADKPADMRNDESYGRAGFPVWGQTEYITATGEFIPDGVAAVSTSATEDPNMPHLFRYGTVVMITCDVDAVGFFVQDVGVTTATTGAVTDAGATGGRTTGANGFWIEAGVTRHVVAPFPKTQGQNAHSEAQVSVRNSACTGDVAGSTTAVAVFGRPCDADADCLHSYDAACSSSLQPLGSYLKIHPTAAAQCSIEIEH